MKVFRCRIDRHGDKNFSPSCLRSRRACLTRRAAHACVARRTKRARVPPMFEARFQTFDDSHERAAAPARLTALRAELKRRGLDGFVVPRADRQQNEYLPASEERLAWLTGFTGSAGAAAVLAERAALFVDGRYTVQAVAQIDAKLFTIEHLVDSPPEQWLEQNLKSGAKLGYDPWLHTSESADRLRKACATASAELVAVDNNPIDALWSDRPAPPAGPVSLRNIKLAGESAADKFKRIQAELKKLRADVLVVSDPQNVAWAFNIRGSDIAHTPLALAFAVIPREGKPALYVETAKLDNKTRPALEEIAAVRAPAELARDLAQLKDKTVRLDQASAADALARLLAGSGGKPVRGADPIALMKAVKNHAEIAGARAAHTRDGVAMARFLAWLEREAPAGKLTEIDAVEALESFRRDSGLLKDISFPTISGSGPNGAIVHYRVTRATNRTIGKNELFLSIPARNTRTAPPTSPAPSRSARRATRCATASPACSRAISPSPPRCSRRIPAAPSSIRWRAPRCGRPGWISTTAPATASAAICRCTRARRASPSWARWRSGAA